MIKHQDLISLGKLIKRHGLKGEIVASVKDYAFPEQLAYIFVLIDHHPIPFAIKELRIMSDETVWITLQDCNDTEIKEILDKDYYVQKEDLMGKQTPNTSDIVGYQVYTQDAKLIGTIHDVDDQTMNLLLQVISPEGEEILIPLAEEYILSIDPEEEILKLNLPQGLLDL